MVDPPRPDPAHGLFETLLVVDGRAVELDVHLDRLGTGLAALFGAGLPAGLAGEIAAAAHSLALGRLRVTVAPDGGAATLATQPIHRAEVFPDWEHGAELGSLPCPGGLGAYKWADRSPLDGAPAGSVPLLLDRGDEVLEAGRANVFAAFGGSLVTPMADGRILPGTTRAMAIEIAREAGVEVAERSLGRDELLAAEEVFLTGSVRGAEPARSLDGEPLARRTELSRLVGDGLRRRWMGRPIAAAAPGPAAAPPPGRLAR